MVAARPRLALFGILLIAFMLYFVYHRANKPVAITREQSAPFVFHSNEAGLLLVQHKNAPPELWDTTAGQFIRQLSETDERLQWASLGGGRQVLMTGDGFFSREYRKSGKPTVRFWTKEGRHLSEVTIDIDSHKLETCSDWTGSFLDSSTVILQFYNRPSWVRASVTTKIVILDIRLGRVVGESGHLHVGERLVFSPDGAFAIATQKFGFWRDPNGEAGMGGLGVTTNTFLIDIKKLNIVETLDRGWPDNDDMPRSVGIVAWSPDGLLVATAASDHVVRIWDGRSGRFICDLAGHSELILGVGFSEDSRKVVTVSEDRSACVWDAYTGNRLSVCVGHEAGLNHGAFDSNGQRVLTGSEDGSARLWDALTGKELCVYSPHESGVRQVGFDRNSESEQVKTKSTNGVGRVWSIGGKLLSEEKAVSPDQYGMCKVSNEGVCCGSRK